MPPNILLVVEPGLGATITRALHDDGHCVQACHSVGAAYEALDRGMAGLVLVDFQQSEVDTVTVIAAMRARTPAPIVLIESGRSADLDRILDAGADDFLSKPFSASQLRARVRVALSDRLPRRDNAVTVGGIRVEPLQRRAWLDGTLLHLSRREFDLLYCLAVRAGEVVSRRELATAVWPGSQSDLRRTIDVHLSWLRHKLGGSAARPRYLYTVRGVGFMLAYDAEPRRSSAAPG